LLCFTLAAEAVVPTIPALADKVAAAMVKTPLRLHRELLLVLPILAAAVEG
jgi:hypothetical protein